ncbi:hypothetical protein C884_00934 [Kocuria palustris PEL]|uniref:Uncharacterized protein n=1 Tax=Kocuria palustris PEL TaxID=1236550 RepID=M2XSZ5_9MICC|nr:hypothetical protein C884_00934 [Kocuria palustris PEL]
MLGHGLPREGQRGGVRCGPEWCAPTVGCAVGVEPPRGGVRVIGGHGTDC